MATNSSPTAYRSPDYIIPQVVILGGIELIVCFGSLCFSIYVYRTHDHHIPLSSSLKCMNLWGIISFLLCNISQCINIYCWNMYYWEFSAVQTMTWYTTWFFWSSGIFMSYLLFLNRIETTFNKSAFSPPPRTMLCLYWLLSIYGCIWMTASLLPIVLYVRSSVSSLDRSSVFEIEFILSIPICIIDVIITLSMTHIFVSRLYRLILLQTRMSYEEQMDRAQAERLRVSLLMTNKQHRMIGVSVKIAILAISSLLSSLILISFRAISFFMRYESPLAKVAAIWIQMDTMISCLCLVLFLPKTQKAFDFFCCCCNALLSKYMEKAGKHSTLETLSHSNYQLLQK